jgi:hypothetical protein
MLFYFGHVAPVQLSAVALIGQPCPPFVSLQMLFCCPFRRSSRYALPLIQGNTHKGILQTVSRSALPLSGSSADAFLPLSGGQAVLPCLLSRNKPTKAHCRRSRGSRSPCPGSSADAFLLSVCGNCQPCPLSLPLADAFLPLLSGQAIMPCHLSRNNPTKAHCRRSAVAGVLIGQPCPPFVSLQMLFCRVMCGNCQPFPCLTY